MTNDVCTLELPGRGTVLAFASDDGTIRLWDTATATPIGAPIHCPGPVQCLARLTTATGNLLVSGGDDGTVRVWDPATGRQTRDPLTGHTGTVWAVCTLPGTDATGAPDGRTLLATTAPTAPSGCGTPPSAPSSAPH